MSWREIAPYLAEQGFQVLVYGGYPASLHQYRMLEQTCINGIDLYGKGYSEAPHTTYDWTLFCTQLALLLQYVRWEAAHVVGFSMVSIDDLKRQRAYVLL